MKGKKNVLIVALIVLISAQFLSVIKIAALPVFIGDTVQSNPFESNPTAGVVSATGTIPPAGGEVNAMDGDFGTNVNWRIGGSTLGITAYLNMTSFENSPPSSFSIGWVDLKVMWQSYATIDDRYRISYQVAPSTDWTPLQYARLTQFLNLGPNEERHAENIAVNGAYDSGEAIYRDADNSGTVSSADTLLLGTEQSIGTTLVPFAADEKHTETKTWDNLYNGPPNAEGVYRDVDNSNSLTASDVYLDGTSLEVGWVSGAAAKFTYSGNPDERVWSNVAEPNDGDWDWTDIGNVKVRFETQRVGSAVEDSTSNRFYVFEVWLSVYEGTYPPAGPGVSIKPAVIPDLGAGAQFFVEIFVTDVERMHGFQFKISYDTGVLTAKEFFSYSPFSELGPSEINDLEGYVAVSYSSYMGDSVGFTGSEPVLRIYFEADSEGESPIHFDIVDPVQNIIVVLTTVLGGTIEPNYIYDGIFATTPVRDLAAIDVTVNATQVMPGGIVGVNVTVANWGTSSETFDVTAYYNETLIGIQSGIFLDPTLTYEVPFDWDTTGVTPAHYQVWGNASIVPDEIDPDNNRFDDGIVIVGRHDVAVTNVVRAYPTQDVAIPGNVILNVVKRETVYVNVTASNLGTFVEKFNVTAAYGGGGDEVPRDQYGDYVVKKWPDISLDPGASQTFMTGWNTETVVFKTEPSPQNWTECFVRGRVTGVPFESSLDKLNNVYTVSGSVNVSRPQVDAGFVISPQEDDRVVGREIRFDGSVSFTFPPDKTHLDRFEWDFGDGAKVVYVHEVNFTKGATHAYTQIGKYSVTLKVVDSLGFSDTETKNVTIYLWNLAITDVAVAFPTPGVSRVKPNEIVRINVTVTNEDIVRLTRMELVNVTISYNNTDIKTLTANVGNGTSTTLQFSWNTTGAVFGTYTLWAKLKPDAATEPYESNKTDNKMSGGSVTILAAPVASFVVSGPSKPIVDETLTFNATASYDNDGEIVEFEWDFGDGTTGTGETVTHKFASKAKYTVRLTATDDDELTGTVASDVTIFVRDVAVTGVSASPTEVTAGDSVTISVTVENKGDFDETVTLTVKYDDTEISSQNVALDFGSSTTVPVVWNTGGVAAGNHTIEAVASIGADNFPDNNGLVSDQEVRVNAAFDILLYLVVGVAVAIVIVGILVYMLKFRKPKPKSP